MSHDGQAEPSRFVVGIALLPAKAKKHLGPKLLQTAAAMGIDIRPVLVGKPLREQGPFDILLHKVRRKEWEEELAQYSKEHPRMRVVDSFDAIRPIMSRFSMLAPLDQDGIRLQVLPPPRDSAVDAVLRVSLS